MRGRSAATIAVTASALVLAVACAPAPTTPPSPVSPVIQMLPDRSQGFYSMPWPNDLRRSAAGMADWSSLPGLTSNPLTEPLPPIPLLPAIVDRAEPTVDRFGTNTAVFMRSLVPLDDGSLPTPAEGLRPDASVQLVELATGERAPAVVVAQERRDRFRPDHLLTVLPYPGHPLHPDRSYGVLVFDTVRTADGTPLERSPLLDQLTRPYEPSMPMNVEQHAALGQQLDAVEAAVVDSTAFEPGDLVAFTVYRTQDTGREWRSVVAALDTTPTPPIQVDAVGTCTNRATDPGAATAIVRGRIALPTWQQGTFPYLLDGGRIGTDGNGRAVRTGTRVAPVQLLVPCTPAPAAGWPVVTFVDGTGGDEDIATTTAPVRRSTMIFGQIAPLYGNGVGDAGSVLESFGFEDLRSQQELVFYNLLNPVAVRTNVLQQASDHLVFTRAVAGFTLDGVAVAQPGAVVADPDRVVIAGHSQGAQTLPFVAAADPDLVDGVVSSAGSGGQYHSIAHGPRRLESVGLLTIAPDRLDELNPLLHMVQTVFEAADGSNVPTTQHFINLTGAADTCTTVETGTHFARAQGLATFALAPEISYGDPDLDRIVATTPVSANSGGATRVQILLPGGHFVYRSNVDRLTSFVQQVHAGTAPVVRPEQFASNTANCAGQRYDDPPRRFGF